MSLFKFTTAVYSNERPSVLAANLSRSLDKIEKNQNMKKKEKIQIQAGSQKILLTTK